MLSWVSQFRDDGINLYSNPECLDSEFGYPMNLPDLCSSLSTAVASEDISRLRTLIRDHHGVIVEKGILPRLLKDAASGNRLRSLQALVELGVDINSQYMMSEPTWWAAVEGAYEAVQWLLDHGANLNIDNGGVPDCPALDAAARCGHLKIVKLLVERGAAINGAHPVRNALSQAMAYGRDDVVEYLRSKGAKMPWELRGEPPPVPPAREADAILGYVEYVLGPAEPLSLQEIIAGTPPITIHVVKSEDRLVLVTDGMSSLPMNVPAGSEQFQYAELVLRLPPDWPLDSESLKSPEYFWPFEWLRRIARHPHENNTWLGGQSFVFHNGEPPAPFASNTKLSCILGLAPDGDLGEYGRSDGTTVVFYSLYPIYAEEADLEKRKGVRELIKWFMKHKIAREVDLHRSNVALK